MNYYLSPSLLAADFYQLAPQLKALESLCVPYLHLDVMDGKFVPSISFGMPVIQALRSQTNFVFDVHLMIEEPIRYLKEFKKAGADIITVHAEACQDLKKTLSEIRALGCKAAVALNPESSLDLILPVLKEVDMVLIMTVHPGFGGQKFMPEVMEKLNKLSSLKTSQNLQFDIEVDGGINEDTLKTVLKAGANVIVAGSAIFKTDIEERVQRFYQMMEEYKS